MDDIMRARQMSPLTLAFLGDAVFELRVREKLAEKGSAPVGNLHRRAVSVVCAKAQSLAAERIAPLLTEEELAVYKRGRNSHSSVPKNADPSEYRSATGLEALFGYLHLCGSLEREAELFEAVWKETGESR